MDSEETMFLYIDETPNMTNLGWMVKSQPWPFELIYSHCHIRFNISNKNNDFGFNSFQKINFQKCSHLNALASKFNLDAKSIKVNLGSSFEQTW